MRIGLIGYGQMGKAVEAIAQERGHTIVFTIDEVNRHDMVTEVLKMAEVILEFTGPESAFENILNALTSDVPVVSGSTGWLDHYEEACQYCQNRKGAFFYASNFSLGANIFMEVNRKLAGLMAAHSGYLPRVEEIHHTRKKDSPSGTALSLVRDIMMMNPQISEWTANLIPETGQIPLTSIREGEVAGTHEVRYVSREDIISLKHQALSRKGLALGAVLAAEFIAGKSGIFTMSDLLALK
jgi:4-hydroxy-tetrahydrodipicolinate reductase